MRSALAGAVARLRVAAAGPWPARIAAALGPAAISVALTVVLASPIPPCVPEAAAMAGPRAGVDARCPTTLIDRQLAAHDRRVIVVGNSLARRGVDPEVLAAGLGLRPRAVLVAALPGSSLGTWYALLAHRVFGRGYRPSDVVLVGIPRSFRTVRPIAGADVAAQLAIAGSEDPALARVAGRRGLFDAWWDRASLRRRLWRAGAIEQVARAARGLQRAAGVADDPDLEEVFGVAGADAERIGNPFGGAARNGEVGLADRVEDTVLPELLALTREHGARLWFARMPIRGHPYLDDPFADAAPPNAPYLDLPGLRLPPSAFRDAFHLGEAGARRYTEALAEELRQRRRHHPRR